MMNFIVDLIYYAIVYLFCIVFIVLLSEYIMDLYAKKKLEVKKLVKQNNNLRYCSKTITNSYNTLSDDYEELRELYLTLSEEYNKLADEVDNCTNDESDDWIDTNDYSVLRNFLDGTDSDSEEE